MRRLATPILLVVCLSLFTPASCSKYGGQDVDGGDDGGIDGVDAGGDVGGEGDPGTDRAEDGGDGGDPGGEIILSDLCNELKKAICDFLRRCELEWWFMVSQGQTCEKIFDCEEAFGEMADLVASGRMEYDANAAGECIDYFSTSECSLGVLFEGPPACEEMFQGLVAEGQDCYREDECAEDLYCDSSSDNCPGRCRPYKALGQACLSSAECDPDVAECSWRDGVCVEKGDLGDICEDVDCKQGLRCDYDSYPAVCVRPGLEGDACTSDYDCQGLLGCIQSICRGPAGLGETCYAGEDYGDLMFACDTGLHCDVDIIQRETIGTCRPKKSAGAECIFYFECVPYLLCIGVEIDPVTQEPTPGQCGQPLDAGAQCNTELGIPECDYDSYCDEQTGVCTAFPVLGDPCVYDEEPECLGNDLYCDSLDWGVPGTCREQKDNGESCQHYEECKSWECINGTCQDPNTCVPTP